jgi:hypothetical protein
MLLLWARPAAATWTLLASGSNFGDTNIVTVSGLSGTGAEVIVVVSSKYESAACVAGDLTDTSSNTYSVVEQAAGADTSTRECVYYKVAPAVSGSMNFSYSPGSVTYPAIVVYIFDESSGTTSFGASASNGTISGGTIAAGTIGAANTLVVEGLAYYVAGTNTIDSGFSTVTTVDYNAATNIGDAGTYKFDTGSVNPTWILGGSVTVAAAVAVSFTGSGGGGGATPKCGSGMLLRGVGCDQ